MDYGGESWIMMVGHGLLWWVVDYDGGSWIMMVVSWIMMAGQ